MRATVHELHFKAVLTLDRTARHLAQQYEPTSEFLIGVGNLDARLLVAAAAKAVELEYEEAMKAKALATSGSR
jgi:hypothetical protein